MDINWQYDFKSLDAFSNHRVFGRRIFCQKAFLTRPTLIHGNFGCIQACRNLMKGFVLECHCYAQPCPASANGLEPPLCGVHGKIKVLPTPGPPCLLLLFGWVGWVDRFTINLFEILESQRNYKSNGFLSCMSAHVFSNSARSIISQ